MNSDKVLHISNDFPNSSIYKQLILHLDQLNIEQSIYSAVRTKKEAEFDPPELSHLKLNIHNILYPYDRLFFRLKIRKIFKDLINHVELSDINLVHAHSFFSDGAVALKIKKHFNIPYIVKFLNSDFNAFIKLRPDLKWRRNKILQEARKVIFASPAYREKFLNILDVKNRGVLESKLITIPNGLTADFLNTDLNCSEKKTSNLKILYVGRFLKLKNVPQIIKTVEKLNRKNNISLTIVGGGGGDQERINKMIKSKPYIDYLGIIKDRDKLRDVYRSHDIFIMVSKPESFGLVYIEALSQGVPIIHTRGEAIDGYFKEGTVAEAVNNPKDIDEIAKKIKLLAERLDKNLKKQCKTAVKDFSWLKIAKQYKSIYSNKFEICSNKS